MKMSSFGILKVSNAVESGLDKAINAYHPNSTQKDQLDYLQTNVSVNGSNQFTGNISYQFSVWIITGELIIICDKQQTSRNDNFKNN